MRDYKEHLILTGSNVKLALEKLDKLAADAILFVINENEKLIGSLTDGDVRRGLLKGLDMRNRVDDFIQENPKFINKTNYKISEIISYRQNNFKIIPVVDEAARIVNILNFRLQKSYLPVDAVVMAGGRGSRLKPLTDTVPKPLLKIGGKAIIDYNVDRLRKFGIDDLWFSIRYLGEQLEKHLGYGRLNNVNVHFIKEEQPLGTIGAVRKIDRLAHDYVLITNSDLLTDLNYEDFFLDFIEKEADFSVVTIPYDVKVPYAIVETEEHVICDFKEKPTYTYYANGGIYLAKKEILDMIPHEAFFDATDLMELLISKKKKVTSFPMRGYWLDIGKPEDFEKAKEDIKHLNY